MNLPLLDMYLAQPTTYRLGDSICSIFPRRFTRACIARENDSSLAFYFMITERMGTSFHIACDGYEHYFLQHL